MSEYIMDPGADLYIGPGGKPYESLGCSCSSARGAVGAADMTPMDLLRLAKARTGGSAGAKIIPPGAQKVPSVISRASSFVPLAPPASHLTTYLLLGGAAVAAVLVVRKLRRRHP